MKVPPARVDAFLRDPGPCRVVLLYGDDAGLIRDRAVGLVRLVAGALDDPFLVVELTRDEIGRLPDEAASLPMTGGRRVVRVREATDAAVAHVRTVLKSQAPGFVVLEGIGLGTRSRLRTELDAAPDGAAIACYPEEGRALEVTIRDTLKQAGATIEPDALSVPAAAVQLGTQGPYVFVIKDGNTAEVRPITIKRTQYGESVIGSGLKAGESVVIDGQLRLVTGARVSVKTGSAEATSQAHP